MTPGDILAIGTLVQYAEKHKKPVKEVVEEWRGIWGELFGSTIKTGRTKPQFTQQDIEDIYNAYPASDPLNNNRPTSKGRKSMRMIEILLRDGVSKEWMIEVINKEKNSGHWLKNFNTFLNNLPYDENNHPEHKEYDPYHR